MVVASPAAPAAFVSSSQQSFLAGRTDPSARLLQEAGELFRRSRMISLRPILPALLRLKGEPYTLQDHFPFEPFFRTQMPQSVLYKTARQVGKSASLAAQGVVQSVSIPYFDTLYITPLFEQARRFSSNYVHPFIETSPLKHLWVSSKAGGSVLQRTFTNSSKMLFSFAFLDAERVRGISASGKLAIDEVQDLDPSLLPILKETLAASKWKLTQYTGTAKSLENLIELLWADSSQAEWCIKCQAGGCGHWNIPALAHDLVAMIGPYRDDISEARPAITCAKCTKPLDPRRHGRWIHGFRDRRWDAAGYHVPQIIMPMHYADKKAWAILLGKQAGKGGTSTNVFFNEVCGESYDVGSKLVTKTELMTAACLPWRNTVDEASQHLTHYLYRVLAVDWGGGGGRLRASSGGSKKGAEQRVRTSFTTLAAMGIRPDGKIDVIWGHRSLRTHDYEHEARIIVAALRRFRCSHLVHDYNGAGAVREGYVRQAGFPIQNIIAMAYHRSASRNLVNFHQASEDHPRDWWSVDKSWSLQQTCEMIKQGLLRFFQYDYVAADDPGLLQDFLALIEEKIARSLGSDVYIITSNPNLPDDFAHSVNLGAMALCQLNGKFPDLAGAAKFFMPTDVYQYLNPNNPDWGD